MDDKQKSLPQEERSLAGDHRSGRSFAESLLAGDAVSPTSFMGEGIKAAFERYRNQTAHSAERSKR